MGEELGLEKLDGDGYNDGAASQFENNLLLPLLRLIHGHGPICKIANYIKSRKSFATVPIVGVVQNFKKAA